jgi:hypothetical protein
MGDTLSTYAGLLKEVYLQDVVENLVFKNNPLLAMIPKDDGFDGKSWEVPVIAYPAAGYGANFNDAVAKSLSTNNGTKGFIITSRAYQLGIGTWTREAHLASRNNAGAFMKVGEVAVENALRMINNQLASYLYRSGYGDRGQIAVPGFSATALTITLANRSDVNNFQVGMDIDVASAPSAAIRAEGTNPLTITNIDRSGGILTFGYAINDATNGIPNIAAGDYIFLRGDHNGSTQIVPRGLEAWLPASPPTSGDNFWGVDRSLDASMLAGQTINAGASSLEEAMNKAAYRVMEQGGALDHFFMSPATYNKLINSQQGRSFHSEAVTFTKDANLGFPGAVVNTSTGQVKVVPDRSCPDTRIFGLTLDTWVLGSADKLVKEVDEDGLFIRVIPSSVSQTQSTFEVRYESYCQLACKAPAHNVNIQITP